MICPHCNHRIQTDRTSKNRIKRRELICFNIEKNITVENLYRKLRKIGYDRTRKTFLRDLEYLEELGKVSRRKLKSDRG